MEVQILSEKDNRLLKRKEYHAIINHMAEKTPQRTEIREKVAALTNADNNRTIIISEKTEYGLGRTKLNFRVYDTADMMKKIELQYYLKRNGFIEKEKKTKE